MRTSPTTAKTAATASCASAARAAKGPRRPPPATVRALDDLIGERTSGPIFLSRTGGPLAYKTAYDLIKRLAKTAGIPSADLIKPHSLRHGFATEALAIGIPLQDVQDALGHRDPRTTRRYDRTRHNLDRSPAYSLAQALRRP